MPIHIRLAASNSWLTLPPDDNASRKPEQNSRLSFWTSVKKSVLGYNFNNFCTSGRMMNEHIFLKQKSQNDVSFKMSELPCL